MTDRTPAPTLPELTEEVLRLSRRLGLLTDETYRHAKRLAEASHTFELAEAKAWVRVRREMGARDHNGDKHLSMDYEAAVTIEVAAESEGLVGLKEEGKALENAGRNLRSQISGVQTVAGALRDEMRLAGRDGAA